jgi:hypothetical protein
LCEFLLLLGRVIGIIVLRLSVLGNEGIHFGRQVKVGKLELVKKKRDPKVIYRYNSELSLSVAVLEEHAGG